MISVNVNILGRMRMSRDFKAEFDEWFEKCELEDVVHAVHELDRYGWLSSVRDDAIDGGEGGQDAEDPCEEEEIV